MSKSDKNSCKKDCPCTSCKGSHNDLEEKFTDYARTVVGRALASPGAADNAAMLGPAQSLGLSAAGVVAQDSLPHIKKAASRVANKVKRFAKGLKSKETRYRDFQDKVHGSSHWNPARGKAVRKGGDIAVSKGIDPGYYPWDKRPKGLKIFESKEGKNSMSINLDESALVSVHAAFVKGAHDLMKHPNVYAQSHGNGVLEDLHNGDYNAAKNNLDLGSMWARDHDRIKDSASMLLNSNNKLAASHAKEALHHLNNNHDHVLALTHVKKAEKAHQFNIKEETQLPDQTPLTKVGATKTGEKLVPEKRKSPSIPENPVTKVIAGKDGEEYKKEKQMSEDKYTRLAEAAFGPLNQNNPFRSAPLKEEVEQIDEISNQLAQKAFVKASTDDKHYKHRAASMNRTSDEFEDHVEKTADRLHGHIERKFGNVAGLRATRALEKKKYGKVYTSLDPKHKYIDEGDVIQFPGKPKPTPKPSKVITTATRRPSGPRPVKENLNQRFPDVERDIAAIMKESYKKAKLKEDATNIYIATPEQRNDWLEVGRGAMDVMDYINKYKV